jgi:microcystin-dependent protein
MKKLTFLLVILLKLTTTGFSQDALIGEIKLFAGNYAPVGWMLCQGQTLKINENQALYSVISNVYGGDGIKTFQIPDLRGRVPVGVGIVQNSKAVTLGDKFGTDFILPNTKLVDIKPGTTNVSVYASPIDNKQTSMGLNYIICINGIYPSRY